MASITHLIQKYILKPKKFLIIMIPVIVALALLCVFLPRNIADDYSIYMMQLSLCIGFVCALKVAQTHTTELRNVFVFLGLFILFILLANMTTFWDILIAVFGSSPYTGLIVAGIAYVMLIISCVNVLKITQTKKFFVYDWVILGLMFVVSVMIVVYPLVITTDPTLDFIISVIFRFFDVLISLMLLPVILLYRHQSTAESKDSITFTVTIIGIILSTTGDWMFEIVSGISHQELSQMFHTGSILDSLYIFSYLLIAIGLYVHTRYGAWSLKNIEEGFKLRLIDQDFN